MSFLGVLRFGVEMITGARGNMPAVGSVAPDFSATTHTGATLRLADLRGKNVVLWFFPKADTPG